MLKFICTLLIIYSLPSYGASNDLPSLGDATSGLISLAPGYET